jgi:NADH-quinone oxidoreductase subunit F/NADP-reducing hydrogenase subunit HndC
MDVPMVYVIKIDESKCEADGDCANICPVKVLELQESSPKRTVVVDADSCLGCMACVNTCTHQAITVTEY